MPKSTKTSSKSQKDTKPHIAILATGGTIAGLADLSTKECLANHSDEYSAGVLSIDEILDSLAKNGYKKHKKTKKSLQNLARISTKQIANIDSVDMSDEVWLTLAREIEAVFSGKVDGIVITHGTDTLEESAYFLHLVAKTQKPIVLVGAMRPANVPNSDGGKNLYNAIALAAHKDAKGVMIAMAGQILSPRYASKAHTHKLNAFCAPSVIGSVRNGKVKFAKSLKLSTLPNLAKKSTNLSKSKKISKAFLQPFLQNPEPFCVRDCLALPKVDILYSYSNDGSAIAAKAFFASGAQGLVIAGSGAGSIHQAHKNALKELILQGVVVVVSSRINGGRVVLKEADKNSGFVSAGELNPQKARVLLMLCLTRTRDQAKIQEYFETY
ncbi:asparaginase [Helicobacter sp. MIT 01-3238]|uniref:asparaginase n=1 Tax=Helicobacter sp. MIT 01-3238 TaxID=398627 RepID=UPI000E1EAE41|nr:asparaginase [Helicobacter sp. MIT 01-3238]RDU51869.1 L-asparaginase [Helicobacter sp. MIT 01-3238]